MVARVVLLTLDMDRRSASRLRASKDTPEDVAARLRRAAAAEQVGREREALYPVITPDNVAKVLAWQERRLTELMR